MKVDITLLKEHPLNQQIYGAEDQDQYNELLEKIKATGWIKPVLVNRNYVILSGHRRVRAAKELGRTEIEVEKFLEDDDKELERLLLENAYREKTTTQKIREAELFRQIEVKKAEERKRFIGLQNLGQHSEVDNCPPSEDKGKTRDIIGGKIGMSGKSYERGRKVVSRADQEHDDAVKFFFEDALNTSIDAASKLAEKPIEFVQEVMERTEDISKVGSVIRELEREEVKCTVSLPVGQHEVIVADLSGKYSPDINCLPISTLTDDNSLLFLWTIPPKLEDALKVGNSWGFNYKTCLVCVGGFLQKGATDKVDILLIFSKGQPEMIIETVINSERSGKPLSIREKISKTYSGTKVELHFDGGGFKSWEYWDVES